jgi:hypothetical protein
VVDLVGPRGLEPVIPAPEIVVPRWIAQVLFGLA